MDNLVLAERTQTEYSQLFILPEARINSEIEEAHVRRCELYESLGIPINPTTLQDAEIRNFLLNRVLWSVYGEAPSIDPDLFDHTYLRSSHPHPNHAYIPLLAVGDVLEVNSSNNIKDEIGRILGNQNKDEALFIDSYLGEFMSKVLRHKVFSGDLYLVQFTPTENQDRFRKEALLYFTSAGQKPTINNDGLICLPDGKPIPNQIYTSDLLGLHYSQDQRRNVALKGNLDLSYVGKLTAHRNAFYKADEPFSWSRLGLLYSEDSEENRGNPF